MQQLAADGQGRYYKVEMGDDLQRLPALMLKEAATLRRASIEEKPFTPRVSLPGSPMLRASPPCRGWAGGP